MAYYITGDCHGEFSKIKLFCRLYNLTTEDVLIVLGDFGLNFWLGKRDIKNKKMLAQLPITILTIHGNHEARPYELDTYVEKQWNGGTVYVEESYPNILFAKDGEVYSFGDKKGIAIGGAYSVDKYYRLLTGRPWFESEQPTEEIKQYVENKLTEINWQVDYVFSHTCPFVYEPADLFLDFINQAEVDKSTEEWLSKLERKLDYERWYFGHFHDNREYHRAEMLYEKIIELGTGTTMVCVGRPKFKKGEFVSFDFDTGVEKIEKYGRIAIVDAYGTFFQQKEVSYDIVDSEGILNKHIPESNVSGFRTI